MHPTPRLSTNTSLSSAEFSLPRLPDDVLAHILLKTRESVQDLMATALTCHRFHQFTEPVLSACKSFSERFLSLDPETARLLFAGLPDMQRPRLLASVSMGIALRNRDKLPTLSQCRPLLAALTRPLYAGGPLNWRVCVHAAPQGSLRLALASVDRDPAPAGMPIPGLGLMINELKQSLGNAGDDASLCDSIVCLTALLTFIGGDFAGFEDAHAGLLKVQDAKAQVNAVHCVLERSVKLKRADLVAPLVCLTGERMSDGSLVNHAAMQPILALCLNVCMDYVSDQQKATWVTQVVPALCAKMQQYRIDGAWKKLPWPLKLLAHVEACQTGDFPREELTSSIRSALAQGGWQFITESQFVELHNQLRFSAHPMQTLRNWSTGSGKIGPEQLQHASRYPNEL